MTNVSAPPFPFITAAKAAERLRVNETTIKKYCRDGLIKAYKIGPCWAINPESVERLRVERANDLIGTRTGRKGPGRPRKRNPVRKR